MHYAQLCLNMYCYMSAVVMHHVVMHHAKFVISCRERLGQVCHYMLSCAAYAVVTAAGCCPWAVAICTCHCSTCSIGSRQATKPLQCMLFLLACALTFLPLTFLTC
jgi:hypothetical protein